jgi:hypothetical protein
MCSYGFFEVGFSRYLKSSGYFFFSSDIGMYGQYFFRFAREVTYASIVAAVFFDSVLPLWHIVCVVWVRFSFLCVI